MSAEFTCSKCKRTFQTARSEEEANAEARANFGELVDDVDTDVLCDDCYKEFMEWFNAGARGGVD